jgi:flagellar protein FliO/FliZ
MMSLTRNRGAGLLSGALMLCHAATAQAAGGNATTPPATSGGESTPLHLTGSTPSGHVSSGGSSGIVRTIVGLFIVIAVIYGVSWVLRQAKRGRSAKTRGDALSPVASVTLGSGKSVQLVRAGRELVLLGFSEHGVTTIRRYSEAEAIEAGLNLPDEPQDAADRERGPARVVEALRRLTVR